MDAVICSYLNNSIDPQRGYKWVAKENEIYPLAESVARYGKNLIVLNNCFEQGIRNNCDFVDTQVSIKNPYIQRWRSVLNYLIANPEIERAFLVDATDVIMQFDPFWSMESDKLYVGDELENLSCPWIKDDTQVGIVNDFVANNPDLLLLNCGVVGGSRDDLIKLCEFIVSVYIDSGQKSRTEMAIFNYVVRQNFNNKIERGRHVTSMFKAYDTGSGAWFKHK